MKDIKQFDSFPLFWPFGVKRSGGSTWSRFSPKLSLKVARDALKDEVRRLGAENLVISTNMRTREDGDVYSNAKEPDDPGVAIYLRFRDAPRSMACDQYRRVRDNTWALAKTISAMRDIDRWGVSEMLERMFTGFKALPAPTGRPWNVVLRVDPHVDTNTVRAAYRALAMKSHPDAGGGESEYQEIIQAWDEFKMERGIST